MSCICPFGVLKLLLATATRTKDGIVQHIIWGEPRSSAHHHDTAAEARECEEYVPDEPPSCPICDAWGCNGAKGLGCDRYERDYRLIAEIEFEDRMASFA